MARAGVRIQGETGVLHGQHGAVWLLLAPPSLGPAVPEAQSRWPGFVPVGRRVPAPARPHERAGQAHAAARGQVPAGRPCSHPRATAPGEGQWGQPPAPRAPRGRRQPKGRGVPLRPPASSEQGPGTTASSHAGTGVSLTQAEETQRRSGAERNQPGAMLPPPCPGSPPGVGPEHAPGPRLPGQQRRRRQQLLRAPQTAALASGPAFRCERPQFPERGKAGGAGEPAELTAPEHVASEPLFWRKLKPVDTAIKYTKK